MPELDFAVLADAVRADGGLGSALAIGMDTVIAPTVPTGQNIGLLVRLEFTRNECGRPHRLEIISPARDLPWARIVDTFSIGPEDWSLLEAMFLTDRPKDPFGDRNRAATGVA